MIAALNTMSMTTKGCITQSNYLPGYEAQLSTSGVSHSSEKLKTATSDLTAQVDDNEPIIIHKIASLPCQSEDDSIAYRCSCSFQIISDQPRSKFIYAMRHAKKAVPIGADSFPIATARIQLTMKAIHNSLNGSMGNEFERLARDLASVSFASSWHDEGDCIVTFNYSSPLPNNEDKNSLKEWEQIHLQGNQLCDVSSITSLILRSKKRKIVIGMSPPFLRDCLRLERSDSTQSHPPRIKISLYPPHDASILNKVQENMDASFIIYEKPEDAFQHPNGNTMLQALNWMVGRLQNIASHYRSSYGHDSSLNLLEMYCGCGAHTMAISKARLFDSIVAIELDQRLVDACIVNCKLNGCYPMEKTESEMRGDNTFGSQVGVTNSLCQDGDTTSTVYPFQGDAGSWSSKCMLRRTQRYEESNDTQQRRGLFKQSYWYSQHYHVLLVDPPRMGLDENVCKLAINGAFEHIIYVSCGRKALKRDLAILANYFDIIDCTLTDLFPRTDSVETLVHLKRKNFKM